MAEVLSANLGYPRIGEHREWKKALEKFWSGALSKEHFLNEMSHRRLIYLQKQRDHNIDMIPVGDFSLYDHVLDTSVMFGVVPERFQGIGEPGSLEQYFAMARGTQEAVASEMTKWFNTNYHYMVPELENAQPALVRNHLLDDFREAKEQLGIIAKPVILGPITYIKLAKGYEPEDFDAWLDTFIPLYQKVLEQLAAEGAEWIQIDEPILSTTLAAEDVRRFEKVYTQFHEAVPQLKVLLQTYFESVAYYSAIADLPVQGLGLDFVHGYEGNTAALQAHGFPADKVLAAGVIDGRNIWRADLQQTNERLRQIQSLAGADTVIVQPSSSLLHVPVTKKNEEQLDPLLKGGLSFADEKLQEVQVLATALQEGEEAVKTDITASKQAVTALNESPIRNVADVQQAIGNLSHDVAKRSAAFSERQAIQKEAFDLPFLPTTSIGSLPQTPEVRKARLSWRRGEWDDDTYDRFVKGEIKRWIEIQEDIGLDVLIHGEFERNDMVEYFGEKLGGFATTKNAWVQSYGSRCVKPPVIYGDVHFLKNMTVKESVYAQSLTDKPVKGMLTGPVTILNWSFVRDDIAAEQVTNQIALALRQEVEALEANGIGMIQVDEPALREGLPLKQSKWADYLDKAVYAFRLATSSVQDRTQIHTHMCYSKFADIIDAISQLDADVIAIEAARSHGELISTFEDKVYDKGIGLGVYDIHSPRVPEEEEIFKTANRALQVLDKNLFWINPDCGLKTRKEEETIPALKAMVQAASELRKSYQVNV